MRREKRNRKKRSRERVYLFFGLFFSRVKFFCTAFLARKAGGYPTFL